MITLPRSHNCIISRFLLTISIVFVSLFYFHYQPFDNSDLGRHLKNGQLFIQNHQILSTNTYSYTHPNFPTITHHWGSGSIFYLVQHSTNFLGLHLFAIIIYLTANLLVSYLACRHSPPLLLAASLVVLAPFFGERNQIRPELFTHLFLALDIFLLELHRHHKLNPRYLYFIPLIHLFWVNTHILFVLGLFILSVYTLDSFIFHQDRAKLLLTILFISTCTSLINPFGLKGLVTPFNILHNYGYEISENQSIFTVLKYFNQYSYITFLFIVFLSTLLLRHYWLKHGLKHIFINAVLIISFGVFGIIMIRQIALFALIFIAYGVSLLHQFIHGLKPNTRIQLNRLLIITTITIPSFAFVNHHHFYSPLRGGLGLGLAPHSQDAGHFLLHHHIQGPIFNNYDIGSYLIYYLYPQQQVFADNRPEAYPASFFQDLFIPAQQHEYAWWDLDATINFNAIIFANSDIAAWAQPFLHSRINDPAWAHIYHDDYVDILVKRNQLNESLIDQLEIPNDHDLLF